MLAGFFMEWGRLLRKVHRQLQGSVVAKSAFPTVCFSPRLTQIVGN